MQIRDDLKYNVLFFRSETVEDGQEGEGERREREGRWDREGGGRLSMGRGDFRDCSVYRARWLCCKASAVRLQGYELTQTTQISRILNNRPIEFSINKINLVVRNPSIHP